MSLCLDTNVFIQAYRVRYPMDLAPGFWDQLRVAAETGAIFSIDEVRGELEGSGDELSAWAEDNRSAIFRENDDEETQQAMVEVGAAIDRRVPPYTDAAKQEFLAGADPWLIAHCLAHGHTLVTEEVGDPRQTGKVRIPDIAALVGVRTINMLAMLRELKFRLVSG